MRLAAPAEITLAELDTSHFKGNAPGAASLRGVDEAGEWFEILPVTGLRADTRHRFPVEPRRVAAQVRLDIYPDGGMGRLRLYGRPADGFLEKRFLGAG